MRASNLLLAMIILASVLLSGCSGSQSPGPIPQPNAVSRPGHGLLSGPGMPVASPDDIEITDDGKIVSNLYYKFWADSVNHESTGRWTTFNNAGTKQWTLTNTAFSAPKAWLMGGNYWNNEEDYIFSNEFTIADNTDGIRLTFMARWKIASGDVCQVIYNTPGGPELVAQYTAGQNPDYPGWTKYYYELPANFSGDADLNELEFYFDSNSSGNDWGFAFDNVAIYQRQLEPPINVDASDIGFSITVTWDYPDTGTLDPEFVDVYRSTSPGGPYDFQESVGYPTSIWGDPTALADTTYYYVLRSTKTGWFNSANSLEDSGEYQGF